MQGAKAQIPGSLRSVRQRAFGRPRRIPGGALHIRDQLHLFPGKLGEGQADHYIFPPVPCPVIDARGDLDDRNSRWQNRQTAMLARTRPGPAGARGTLREKLVKIGAKVVSHGRYVTFQLAEVAVPRELFRKILSLIDDLRPRPAPA